MIHPTTLNRRTFLGSGARYGLLAGMGGLLVATEWKRRRLAGDPNCIRLVTCAECLEFGTCRRPKAGRYRRQFPEGRPPAAPPPATDRAGQQT